LTTRYHVGTSGWHYEEWGGGLFYPEGLPKDRWLEFYARRFDTVEVNNTFYRLPKEEVTTGWGRQAPAGFQFTMKASRRITHEQRLKDCESIVTTFLSRFRAVGDGHTGAILYQLPPYQRRDDALLEGFLKLLPRDLRHAFEFRHRSWAAPECLDLLRRYGAALCIHDMPGVECPVEATTHFAYFRFHGNATATEGDYSDEELRTWAARIRNIGASVERVFVYFDNDEAARALANAQTLRDLLAQQGPPTV